MSLSPIAEPAHVFGNASTATIPVVPGIAGRPVAIHKLIVTASAATNITLQDSSGAALSQALTMSGSKTLVIDQNDNGDPFWVAAAGRGVQLAQSGSANIGFDAYYMLGPAPPLGPTLLNQYVAEDAVTPYLTEDGTNTYIME